MPEIINVVIPCRVLDVPDETIQSLFRQTYKHLEFVIVVDAEQRGQSWARNKGLSLARRRLVLFSDFDCRWNPEAVEALYEGLRDAQERPSAIPGFRVGYAYGGYRQMMGERVEKVFGMEAWDWPRLQMSNYISTMSLIDAPLLAERGCLLFDERLRRLEDWDLWLRCGQKGISGIGVNRILFDTDVKPGVSYGGDIEHHDAEIQVKRLRGLR